MGHEKKLSLQLLIDITTDWLTEEAEDLIGKAYKRHQALADTGKSFPPSLSATDLEAIGTPVHYAPQTTGDKVALATVHVLEKFMSLFFRDKYDHHAVTLETVAAGMYDIVTVPCAYISKLYSSRNCCFGIKTSAKSENDEKRSWLD